MQRTPVSGTVAGVPRGFHPVCGFRTKPSSFDRVERARRHPRPRPMNTLIAQARGEITGPLANQIIAWSRS